MLRTHCQKDSHLWKRPWTRVSKLAVCFVVVVVVAFCVQLRPRSSDVALWEIKNVLWVHG